MLFSGILSGLSSHDIFHESIPIKAAPMTSEHLPHARRTQVIVTSYFTDAVTVLENSDLGFEPVHPACLSLPILRAVTGKGWATAQRAQDLGT